ncbi:MAG: J domain-containing protein [Candidatus Omnitrophica bacterium]|nr:J domain-containing protein [Candidatus Omnitrophota bacterium]
MNQDRTTKMYQRIFAVIQEEMQGWMSDQLATLLKSLGIEASQLQGMATGQTTFNPYATLGLDKSASDGEVKKRYRELLRILHPDTAGVEGTAFLLQIVLAAYEMIKQERGWH